LPKIVPEERVHIWLGSRLSNIFFSLSLSLCDSSLLFVVAPPEALDEAAAELELDVG
jgi:hypothetical protein